MKLLHFIVASPNIKVPNIPIKIDFIVCLCQFIVKYNTLSLTISLQGLAAYDNLADHYHSNKVGLQR